MTTIHLDGDEAAMFTIDNIGAYNTLDELLTKCGKKFKMEIELDKMGFKTKAQGILISDIGDIDKSKRQDTGEQFM